jgi:hypothetical protein
VEGEFPKLAGNFEGIDAGFLPPSFLVTRPMDCAVMGAAKRDREFIARLAAKRPRLHKSDVMGLRGFAAAQYAGLLGYEPQVFLVALALWRADGEHALIDPSGLMCIRAAGPPDWFRSRTRNGSGSRIGRRSHLEQIRARRFGGIQWPDACASMVFKFRYRDAASTAVV